MQNNTQHMLNLFVANARTAREVFTWSYASARRLAAFIYARQGMLIDCSAINFCSELIKTKTSAFSAFRGGTLCTETLLSLSRDPRGLVDEMLKAHGLLKKEKFLAGDYSIIAAQQIAEQMAPSDYSVVASKARALYKDIKSRHFFGTGTTNTLALTGIVMSGIEPMIAAERIEMFQSLLKGVLPSKSSRLILAQTFVLAGADDSAVNRVIAIGDALKARKINIKQLYLVPMLGVLALLPNDADAIARDIEEVQAILKMQKGFRALYVSKQELFLFAAAVVAIGYPESMKNGVVMTALITGVLYIIMMQRAAASS
jgi:hypothetical protein